MFLNDVKRVVSICVYADVVPELVGHRGIGKTQLIKQVGASWEDAWMPKGQQGIPVFPLYCATQDVADLIGFPIQIWESTGTPVTRGIESTTPNDRIVTSWAEPEWVALIRKQCEKSDESDEKILAQMKEDNASEEEIWAFWNRPKAIVFLDEIKRAPREVIQAMYPFILDKTLHMHTMPRGTRVATADNFAGSYDLREPDEAFMSRLCHIEVDADMKTWNEWAVEHKVTPKIRHFLTATPAMLLQVPKDQEEASVHYQPIPDPRSWGDLIDRVEKYGHLGLPNATGEIITHTIKQVFRGILGHATAEAYAGFKDEYISIEDILAGKGNLKKILAEIPNDVEKNKLKEKLQIEAPGIMKNRPYVEKEAERLKNFLLDLGSKERATAILQSIFTMKNSGELDDKWVRQLMQGKEIMKLIEHLINIKNI